MHHKHSVAKSPIRAECNPLPVWGPLWYRALHVADASSLSGSIHRSQIHMGDLVFCAHEHHPLAVWRNVRIRVAGCGFWLKRVGHSTIPGNTSNGQGFGSPSAVKNLFSFVRISRIN